MGKYIVRLNILLFSVLCSQPLFSQETDMIVVGMINNPNRFKLIRKFPKLKDSMQSEYIRRTADFIMASSLNKPKYTINLIATLLYCHSSELDLSNTDNLRLLALDMEKKLGHYNTIVKKAKKITDSLIPNNPELVWKLFDDVYKRASYLSKFEPPYIKRPYSRDVEVKYEIFDINNKDKLAPGNIYIPVILNNNTYRFIFDIGAPFPFMSKEFAQQLRLETHEEYNDYDCTHLDILCVGNIIVKNPIVYVNAQNDASTDIASIIGIIGLDFMKHVNEFRIDTNNRKIIFQKNRHHFRHPDTICFLTVKHSLCRHVTAPEHSYSPLIQDHQLTSSNISFIRNMPEVLRTKAAKKHMFPVELMDCGKIT